MTPHRPSRFGIDATGVAAPAWSTSAWFNTDGALQLADLRDKVVVLHAFQMLCPACVHHGLPQAQRIRAAFAPRCEPASERGPGIAGDSGERRKPHPSTTSSAACRRESA